MILIGKRNNDIILIGKRNNDIILIRQRNNSHWSQRPSYIFIDKRDNYVKETMIEFN